jgi:hypothetical protein
LLGAESLRLSAEAIKGSALPAQTKKDCPEPCPETRISDRTEKNLKARHSTEYAFEEAFSRNFESARGGSTPPGANGVLRLLIERRA